MSLKDSFIIILLLCMLSITKSQAQLVMTAGMAEGYAGETVCIDVEITGFGSISAFEFGLSYDSLIAKPVAINTTAIFDANEFKFIDAIPEDFSEVRFLGYVDSADDSVIDYPVPNGGGIIAEVCYLLVGEPGEMVFLDFTFTGNEIAFTQDLGDQGTFTYEYTTNSGKLTILPEDDSIGIVASVCNENIDVTNDGSISFMAVPGLSTTGPYSWEILNGLTLITSGTGLVGNADDLSNGAYTIRITDSSSPAIIVTKEVEVLTSPQIIIEANVIQPTCSQGKGRIEIISATLGLDNYNIKWESVEHSLVKYGQTTLFGIYPGDYLLTLTNQQGCEYTEVYTLTAPDPIQIENIVLTRDCYNSDAHISGDITGGTLDPNGDYKIDIIYNDGIIGGTEFGVGIDLIVQDENTVNGPILIDSILFEIRDSKGCTADTTIYLPRPSKIELDTSSIVSCDGNQATVIASGGAGNYTYIWSHDPNESSAMSSGLPAGTTSVLVRDENDCSATTSFYFDNSSTGNINFEILTTPVSCYDDVDGTANITVDDESEWTISWFTDIALTNEITALSGQFTASNLSSGIYYVSAFNSTLNCPVEEEVVINTPAELELSVNFISDITCGDVTNGSIKVTGSGGNNSGIPNYTFTISSGASSMVGESVTFSSLGMGDYTIIMTDESNCSIDTILTVGQDSPMSIEIDPATTAVKSCNREFGSFGVNVTGGQEPYSFTWTRNGTIFTTTSESVLPDLESGTYRVSVTDDTGCRVELDSILNIIDVQAISFDVEYDFPACFGERTCLRPIDIQGGTGDDYKIQVDFGNILPITECVEVFAGLHSIVIIDGDNCASEEQQFVIEQPEEIIVDAGEDQKVNLGESSEEISVSIMSQNSIDQILWSPDLNLEYLTLDSQVVVSTPSDDIEYTVTVINDQGCTASDVIFIDVNKSRRIPMANIFNPNGNGNNDFFTMQLPSSVTTVSNMQIYDRWGNTLYDEQDLIPTNGFIEGWNGKVNGEYVSPGVYVWMASFEFIDGHTSTRSGSITVIR